MESNMMTEKKKRIQRNRTMFTVEEDQKILALNEQYPNDWKKIAKEMGNRTSRQCRERYYHYLSPSINNNEWTEEEDALLISKVNENGKRWKLFEFLFDRRTEISIRNRWNVLRRKNEKSIRETQKIQKILQDNYCEKKTFVLTDAIEDNSSSSKKQNEIEQRTDSLELCKSIFNESPAAHFDFDCGSTDIDFDQFTLFSGIEENENICCDLEDFNNMLFATLL